MGIYDRDHRQNDPWKKKNDSFKYNEAKGEVELDNDSKLSPNEIKKYYESIVNIQKKNDSKIINEEVNAFNTANKQRRIQKQFDEQQKIKLKEFKQIWKLEESNKKTFVSFIPWIIGLLIILVVTKEINKRNIINTNSNETAVTTEPDTTTESDIKIEQPLFQPTEAIQTPSTSVLSTIYETESATCPLKIIANQKNHYIKLCDTMRGDATIATFFVRAGEELTTKVPAGTYKIKFGAGDEWYGEKELFGAFSQYGESESLNFIYNGYASQGHTISFYQQVNGNFHTNNIGRDAVLQNQ